MRQVVSMTIEEDSMNSPIDSTLLLNHITLPSMPVQHWMLPFLKSIRPPEQKSFFPTGIYGLSRTEPSPSIDIHELNKKVSFLYFLFYYLVILLMA